jgi:hypothetical protein
MLAPHCALVAILTYGDIFEACRNFRFDFQIDGDS